MFRLAMAFLGGICGGDAGGKGGGGAGFIFEVFGIEDLGVDRVGYCGGYLDARVCVYERDIDGERGIPEPFVAVFSRGFCGGGMDALSRGYYSRHHFHFI